MPRPRRWSRSGSLRAAGMVASLSVTTVALARVALACGALAPASPTAFPAGGAIDVPPTSSIVVVGRPDGPPQGLSLTAAGMPVPLPPLQPMGTGWASGIPAGFYRLPGPLTPSSEYVLWFLDPMSMVPPRELTRFTTGASYDKPVGTPARLDRLRLWRVRYPLKQIGAGGCVFDQYHGYIDVSYQDGTIPGTPPAEVIGTWSLLPENGAAAQTLVFVGRPFGGHSEVIPEGGLPQPSNLAWRPELAPDRRYCLTLQQQGRNDLAILPVRSNSLCAEVINVDLSGGETDGGADAGVDGALDGGTSDSSGSDAGAADSSSTGAADSSSTGAPTDAEKSGGGVIKRDSRGCAVSVVGAAGAGAGGRSLSLVALGLMGVLAFGRRSSAKRRGQR